MPNKIESWSWQELVMVYQAYGQLIGNFQFIKDKCILLGLSIGQFEIEYGAQIAHIDAQVAALDREIARRNALVLVV